MNNDISLSAVAGGSDSSREGEGGSSETLCTLNVDSCICSPSLPGTEPSVQAVMSLWGWEDRIEIVAALQREGGSLREHGKESWHEIE